MGCYQNQNLKKSQQNYYQASTRLLHEILFHTHDTHTYFFCLIVFLFVFFTIYDYISHTNQALLQFKIENDILWPFIYIIDNASVCNFGCVIVSLCNYREVIELYTYFVSKSFCIGQKSTI